MDIEGEFWVMKKAELTHDHLQIFAAEPLDPPGVYSPEDWLLSICTDAMK